MEKLRLPSIGNEGFAHPGVIPESRNVSSGYASNSALFIIIHDTNKDIFTTNDVWATESVLSADMEIMTSQINSWWLSLSSRNGVHEISTIVQKGC